jgi:hypothetical protein
MTDANEYDGCVDKMINIFTWGYGIEAEMRLSFINTNIRHYIEPYIHLNLTELTTNLNTAVVGGFLSKQTASEKLPYSTPQEWERIQAEKKEEQAQELLLTEQKLEIQSDIAIEQAEALAEIDAQYTETTTTTSEDGKKKTQGKSRTRTKGSVATGRGRKNTSGKMWDDNGNEIDPMTGKAKSKWDKWNKTH